MTTSSSKNMVEHSRKTIYAIFFSFIGLVLLGASFWTVRIVRDEVNQGFERSLILREPRPSSDLSQNPPQDLLLVADGLENRPYRLRVDENGFIKPSAVHEKAEVSVVFLGGSTTECRFVDEEQRFPHLVGRNLEASLGKRVNSFNTGRVGNNTLHCDLLLQGKVLPMRPNAAVLMECISDLASLMVLGDYWGRNATPGIIQDKDYNPVKTWIIHNLVGHNQTPAMLNGEPGEIRNPAQRMTPQELSSRFRKNIELFVFVCRQHDITPVLMTQFNRLTERPASNLEKQLEPVYTSWGMNYERYRVCYNALNETMRAVAREQNVLLVDLDRLVPKTKAYMYDVVHLNADGSRFVADLVAKSLEPVLR